MKPTIVSTDPGARNAQMAPIDKALAFGSIIDSLRREARLSPQHAGQQLQPMPVCRRTPNCICLIANLYENSHETGIQGRFPRATDTDRG